MPCVTPPTIQNPFLHNSVIEALQNDLSTLVWVDDIFPLVDAAEQVIGEERILVPVVFKQDGTKNYIPLTPDGSKRAGVFFELENGDFLVNRISDEIEITINIICYANLKNISSKTHDYTDELITSMLQALDAGTYSSDITEYRVIKDKQRIYDKYGYSFEQLKNFMYPYTAFKIQMTITADYSLSCVSPSFDASYSPSC